MLQLSFILQDHGWAVASISSDDITIEVPASYLSDALGDLARAARAILRGLPEATFSFQGEPCEHRVVVSCEGDAVTLSVSCFADTFSRLQHGELVLRAHCTLHQFATACINCLRRILDEHGQAGYHQRWKNHEFPMAEYRELLDLRRAVANAGHT